MSITFIGPRDYWKSDEHRSLADQLVAVAGVDLNDVASAEKFPHGWRLKVYKRRRRSGRKYITARGHVAYRWVNVPDAVLAAVADHSAQQPKAVKQ